MRWCAGILFVACGGRLTAAVLLSDDFAADDASRYSILQPPAPDSSATFGFDYTGLLTADNGAGARPFQIPAAPQTTDGTSKALRLEVNPQQGSAQAINVYPDVVIPPGTSFQVMFDVFARVPGSTSNPYAGGTGSTQRLLIGVNHSGTRMVNIRQSAPANPKLTQNTDGYFFCIGTDGDFTADSTIGRDYEFRKGATNTSSPNLSCRWFGEIATDSRLLASDLRFRGFFTPALGFHYSANQGGAPGDNWITVRARWKADTFTFFLDMKRKDDTQFRNIFEYTDAAQAYDGGRVLIGLEDPTSGSASTLNTGYQLVDNLVIETTSPDSWMLY